MRDSILSVLEGALRSKGSDDKAIKVKSLRKMVLLSLQQEEDDKTAKKEYKKSIKALEKEGLLLLDTDGLISLPAASKKQKKRKRKDKDADGKSKKREKTDAEPSRTDEEDEENADASQVETDSNNDGSPAPKSSSKGNPQGVTRLFVGNLPFAVDEAALKAFLPGVTHIKWITDKDTGAFYGSSFVEMENSEKAADAVAKAGSQLMGRPIKVNYAPARPGDVWPPTSQASTGNKGSGQAGGSGVKAMSPKPDNCKKLFIGNLSYDIDDDGITKFFSSVDSEVKTVRWLHHKDSGDFKGCGFVEFWNPEDCSKAAALNGKTLLGRPIRIDWSD